MKKIIYYALAVAFSAAVSGCSSDVPRQNTSNSPDIEAKMKEEQQEDYVVKIDDSFDSGVKLGDVLETLSPEEADFRNLKWGMTKEEVTYAQGTGYREPDENTLYYTRVREEDYPADAEYTFTDGKLSMGIFYITENKEGEAVLVKDYDELCATLGERYGTPRLVDTVYTADITEEQKADDKDKQAEFIENGKLQLRTAWTLDDTELRVVMFARNGGICIGLQYKNAAQ